jgi:hypothetical protein
VNLSDRGDSLDWARRVLRRVEGGQAVPLAAQAMALSALRLVRSQLSIPEVDPRSLTRDQLRRRNRRDALANQSELPL